jgi:hypothetical protein
MATAKKRGPGRPAWVMPPVSQIEGLAARMKNDAAIARVLGIRPETLARKKRQFEQFNEAILTGRAKGESEASDVLYQALRTGSLGPGPLFFYLERKCGWTKPSESEAPSATLHRGLSSDLVAVLRESLLGELRRPRPAELIEPPPTPITTTAVTVADKRAELLGRNGDGDGSDD